MTREVLISEIANVSRKNFNSLALKLFRYQYTHNSIYRSWVDSLNVELEAVDTISKIPFLPISAFKNHAIRSGNHPISTIFESSATTGTLTSKHHIVDVDFYLQNCERIFNAVYGKVQNYAVLALLPSYLERNNSSLVRMIDHFIKCSLHSESGFYLYNHKELYHQLEACSAKNIPTVLFGVSFGLLDFVENYKIQFEDLILIETGGMKGRKKEMIREELHQLLKTGFAVETVHSEYGMTELLSQAYSKSDGLFIPPDQMKIVIKELTDPLSEVKKGKTGIINIIDLANIDSCSFIETQDLGRIEGDGYFEVLGRVDASDIRGCNLMVGDL